MPVREGLELHLNAFGATGFHPIRVIRIIRGQQLPLTGIACPEAI
jgi:hypothetical protein